MAGGIIGRAWGAMARSLAHEVTLPVPMPIDDRSVVIRRGYPAGDPRGRVDAREDVYSAGPGLRLSGQRVRDYCRRLSEDNVYAKRGVNVLASQSVRYGVTPIFPSKNRRTKKAQEAGFRKWNLQANITGVGDYNGIQGTIAREYFAVGEVFVRRHIVGSERALDLGLDVPLQFEIIRSEQVPFESFRAPNGNRVIDGIEIDDFNLEVAVWVTGRKPGEPAGAASNQKIRLPIYRMFGRAAVEGEIMHIKRPGGGYRGRSDLEAARSRLGAFDRYSRAVLTRSEVEACFAAFVTESDEQAENDGMPRDPAEPDAPLGDADGYEDDRLEWIEPGRVQYLKKGQKVEFANPQSSGGLEVFARETLRGISVGIGVPYERLTNDLSKVSYVSFKAGEIQFKSDIEVFQWTVLVPQFLIPSMALFSFVGYLKGKWDNIAPEGMNFGMPRWDSADPTKELTALALEMQIGLTSYIQAKAERGEDWQVTFDEMAEVAKEAASRSLTGFSPLGIGGKAKAGADDDASAPEDPDAVQSDDDAPKPARVSGRAKRVEK